MRHKISVTGREAETQWALREFFIMLKIKMPFFHILYMKNCFDFKHEFDKKFKKFEPKTYNF